MNQDQIIRFLMDNIDAEALAEANRNGSTIMYFAGVAQRFPNTNQAANNRVPPRAPVEEVRAARQPAARMNVRQPAPQQEEQNEAPPAQAPVRQAPRRAARDGNEGDAVRVGRL